MTKNANGISLKKSCLKTDGKPNLPSPDKLVFGELAINYAEGVETISTKNESGDVVTFSSDDYFKSQNLAWEKGIGEGSAKLINNNGVAYNLSVSEGYQTSATSYASHAEGQYTKTGAYFAHAEGTGSRAMGEASHAEGQMSSATTNFTHAEGDSTLASSWASHAEGGYTVASGSRSHAEGYKTSATTEEAHAEGYYTLANEKYAHAEGQLTVASGQYSHAEGAGTSATTYGAHAEGIYSRATGYYSHAEGSGTTASSQFSHAEGVNTKASNDAAHAEGQGTSATSKSSHAEGFNTKASAYYSHAEGEYTSATSEASHAEGSYTKAYRTGSHAEGQSTQAIGDLGSHAEGNGTIASGISTHAEGHYTQAFGDYSHAEGFQTKALNRSEHSCGQNNISSSASTTFGDSGNTLFSVGNGSNTVPHNAFEIRQNGDIYIVNKNGTDVKLQDEIGNIDVDQVIDSTTSASTNPVSTSGVYDFVTSYTPSITVDQVIDSGTSASTNAVATHAVYDVIVDNEMVWANAFAVLSGVVSSHTENTDIHVTSTDKDNLATLADNIETITNITPTKISNWDAAAANSHSHSNKSALDSITGNVGTMAYEAANSYSSATEVNTALGNKLEASDVADFFDDAKYEDSGTTKVINFYHGSTIKATIDASDFIKDGMIDDVRIENGYLVIDFNTASGKQDIRIPLTDIFNPANYYNKAAIDTLVGSGFTSSSITDVIIENEEITSAALTDLDNRKLDATAYTPTDLSNYYQKSETSGATEISNALGGKVSSAAFTAHTSDTDIHLSETDRLIRDTLIRRTRKNFTASGMTYFVNTLKSAIADQCLEKCGMKVGDYYSVTHNGKTYNYVIAGLNTMKGISTPYRLNINHIGIIVDTNATQAWNTAGNTYTSQNSYSTGGTWTTGSSAAGYANCDLHYYLTNTVLPNVKTDLGSGNIKNHYKLYSNAVNTSGYNRFGDASGCASSWAWYANQEICALSEVQVYGSAVWSSSGYDTGEACRQLDVFRVYNMNEIFEGRYPWLRDVASASRACHVGDSGGAGDYFAYATDYVAALILFA